MHTCVEYISPWNLCILAKSWFVAYGYFMEGIELGSHLFIKPNISDLKVTVLDMFNCICSCNRVIVVCNLLHNN